MNPNDPKFRAAQQACAKNAPGPGGGVTSELPHERSSARRLPGFRVRRGWLALGAVG